MNFRIKLGFDVLINIYAFLLHNILQRICEIPSKILILIQFVKWYFISSTFIQNFTL